MTCGNGNRSSLRVVFVAMVVTLFGAGLVGDLHVDARTLHAASHRVSRYVLEATEGQESISVEHLERSAYILVVSRGGPDEEWRAVVRAQGYVKTRLLDYRGATSS